MELLLTIIYVTVILVFIYYNLKEINMSFQEQLVNDLGEVLVRLGKVEAESRTLLARIDELTDIIGQEPELISPELAAAVEALKAQVAVIDDLVPDAVEEPAEPEV